MITFPHHRRAAQIGLFVLIVLFFGLNLMRSHELGQDNTMYDNPIYRWRESMAIALSRMQPVPTHGYVAYRSIRDYLNHHGLALMAGEADPLPTAKQRRDLIFDAVRMDKLLQAASRVPVDRSLPPVVLKGNEKGLADYYYFAFEMFGTNLFSLWLLYFVILGISVILFIATFRKSPFCLLLLLFYLAVHFSMIDYARHPYFVTVHNSRFFPALSVLPAMHLLLLLVREERPRPSIVAAAAGQLLLLCFVIFCRAEAVWESMAVVACGAVLAPHRELLRSIRRPRLFVRAAGMAASSAWPASMTALGMIALTVYNSVALDRQAYAGETKTHVFWHTLYSGTVGADPELRALYLHGEKAYRDNVSYYAALAYVREHHDTRPEIAHVSNGEIYINPMKNMGVYDGIVRRAFFEMVKNHPWLVAKSIFFEKPMAQFAILAQNGVYRAGRYTWTLLMALVAVVTARAAGAPLPRRQDLRRAGVVLLVIAPFATLTTFVIPSLMVVGAVATVLLVLLLLVVYLPIVGVAVLAARRRRDGQPVARVAEAERRS